MNLLFGSRSNPSALLTPLATSTEKVAFDTARITTLTNRQFCVVLDPIGEDGKPQLGHKELRKGEISFFLRPGEKLENGIQTIHVLGEEEALLLSAKQIFKDETAKETKGIRRLETAGCYMD
jgi:hypothetical protein